MVEREVKSVRVSIGEVALSSEWLISRRALKCSEYLTCVEQ